MNDKTARKTNKKALTSFSIIFLFLILPVSGFLLHTSDHGGSAQDKHLFMTVHNLAAFLFTIAATVHILNNRKVIAHYIKNYKREIGISLLVALVLMSVAGLHALAL